mmetsp:Transcript_9329/g.14379  ORF Transcript_9329/g.14379 Transcript_9329/m.14379 type:complete len:814 (-) Transcript_9329:129-2570(-)
MAPNLMNPADTTATTSPLQDEDQEDHTPKSHLNSEETQRLGRSKLKWPEFTGDAVDYDWKSVHQDLENSKFAGCYGWDNAAYWGIAERKAGIDLQEWYKQRTEAEYYLPNVDELIRDPQTQQEWDGIFTFDPMGMYAHPPTIAACKANLDIEELKSKLPRDGEIVSAEDGQIRTQKAAICYAWNLPRLSQRLQLSEDELRQALFKFSGNPSVLDETKKTFLPAVGGCTIYIFGDVRKLRDPKTEVAVRVHDECIGSDVFGSDICTCRPYLIFALEQCIRCAQRGGVGLVIYFRKEGRSLGEVVKFRVYNARENQQGGDSSQKYFHHTESIAGIRDARFQVMMPDALKWLGVKRIDWLCSMSNEKYEAIVGAGIKVMQRVTLPEDYVKENMKVEIGAKIASGYQATEMDVEALADQNLSLSQIRKQCRRIYELGLANDLEHFELHLEKMPDVVNFVKEVIAKNYPGGMDTVKPHSRVRHLENVPAYQEFVQNMHALDPYEQTRRLLDLVTVSVLVDAGAGSGWKYYQNGQQYKSSEGLAVASLDMFLDGAFSSDQALKHRVNSYQLIHNLSKDAFCKGFQVHEKENPLMSVDGRFQLLKKLGTCLEQNPQYFGSELQRPGNMLDYVLSKATVVESGYKVSLSDIWDVCARGLKHMWPQHAGSIQSGDIWQYHRLTIPGQPGSDLVPFHKLTQWLIYSLVEVLEMSPIGIKVVGLERMTALAEYRNGGLLADLGVLKLKDSSDHLALHPVGSEVIVEWRALTIVLMDQIAAEFPGFSLAQVLEGGTWSAGRVIARKLRPPLGPPPIQIRSDGTVF